MWANSRVPKFDIHGLPRIDDLHDLSVHCGFTPRHLWRLLSLPRNEYRTFRLPKRSGGFRQIAQPSPALMLVQRWVLDTILRKLQPSTASHGFVPGSKLLYNARPHIGAKALLKLDLRNFFPSISSGRVMGVFVHAGYERKPAAILTRLCTYNGALPQGAPSSPHLSNLCCRRLDARLMSFAEQRGFVYTRYADDMTVSSRRTAALAKARNFIVHIVRDSGFRVNGEKTRLYGPRRALVVTGLTVSSTKAGIGRRKFRWLRARLHRVQKEARYEELPSLQGWLDFVSDVDPDRYRALVRYVGRLVARTPGSSLSDLRLRAAG